VPSNKVAKDWEINGALRPSTEALPAALDLLRSGDCSKTLVLPNRYDGIDLPDAMCRILIIDGLPTPASLSDRIDDRIRDPSEIVWAKTLRSIEQGIGRSVRGEKDYSVIILTGRDLPAKLRSSYYRKGLSDQTNGQIEIGLSAVKMVADELGQQGGDHRDAVKELMEKCLRRDEGWKAWHAEGMNAIPPGPAKPKLLKLFHLERQVDLLVRRQEYERAAQVIQTMVDKDPLGSAERGWYLQQAARILNAVGKDRALQLQQAAHGANSLCLKPKHGIVHRKINPIDYKRADTIREIIGLYPDIPSAILHIEGILSEIRFGVNHNSFETAFKELGRLIGFRSERPEAEMGEGPDNLWCISSSEYILWEHKGEVKPGRIDIHKSEAEQVLHSLAWFRKEYAGVTCVAVLSIPTIRLGKGVSLGDEVRICANAHLSKLTKNVRSFFRELAPYQTQSITEAMIDKFLEAHSLRSLDMSMYYTKPKYSSNWS